MKNKKILVIMGGTSSEREISLRSGEAVYNALLRMEYNAQKFILNDNNACDIIKEKPDLCVLTLHGKGGEDGSIQGMLELANIKYTGSGVAASANCMNKIITKKLLDYDDLPTPDFCCVKAGDDYLSSAKSAITALSLPIVVKAPCQGSSVGVEIANNLEELVESIQRNMEYDGEILLEKFIKGVELSVPVMKDNGNIIALPMVEIVSENDFYDFESKYTDGMSHHIIPARISDDISKKINKFAIEAYKALSCNGVVRIDFFVDAKGNPFVIEINTIPGMTATSLVPDSAKAVGISFDEFVEKSVLEAFK